MNPNNKMPVTPPAESSRLNYNAIGLSIILLGGIPLVTCLFIAFLNNLAIPLMLILVSAALILGGFAIIATSLYNERNTMKNTQEFFALYERLVMRDLIKLMQLRDTKDTDAQ